MIDARDASSAGSVVKNRRTPFFGARGAADGADEPLSNSLPPRWTTSRVSVGLAVESSLGLSRC